MAQSLYGYDGITLKNETSTIAQPTHFKLVKSIAGNQTKLEDMDKPNIENKSQQSFSKRLWWIPTLGFGIALLLLVANGWVSMEMTSQFREYGSEFLKEQTTEQLKSLAEEESQLIELAVQSLMRGRGPNDLLTEEFSILFTYDLVAVLNRGETIEEAYLFSNKGTKKIEAGSPWFVELSKPSHQFDFRPVSFRFVTEGSHLYILYSIRDPREYNDKSLILGRKMPAEFETFPGNSNSSFRVIPVKNDSSEITAMERWDLSTSSAIEEWREFDPRRGGRPRTDNRRRFTRGGPPGRGGPNGGQESAHPAPFTTMIINRDILLSEKSLKTEEGDSRAMVFANIEGFENSEPVRIEILISRDFPETLESTINAIRRNSLGVSLLVCLFTLVVVIEMRRRKTAQTKLRSQNVKLNEANQRKDRLLAIISHDLRAPLTGVSNLSGLLMKQPESFSADEIRKFAGEIQGTSKHLTELLDNLLNWARLQTGQLPYFPGTIDLDRVTHQIRTLFASTAENSEVLLIAKVKQHANLVNDVEMLRTILRNLVSNAIRHTPNGGNVMLNCEPINDRMRIEVRDTGNGMSPEEISQLFQLPDKPRDPTEVGKKGAGFGLVLSQMLAKRMGGQLNVVTSSNEGTTFRLEIPMQWLPEGNLETTTSIKQ